MLGAMGNHLSSIILHVYFTVSLAVRESIRQGGGKGSVLNENILINIHKIDYLLVIFTVKAYKLTQSMRTCNNHLKKRRIIKNRFCNHLLLTFRSLVCINNKTFKPTFQQQQQVSLTHNFNQVIKYFLIL
jgi:hypothetical protein